MNNPPFDLTCATFGDTRSAHYDIAILPWGATEPHNLHLPYLTDALTSRAVALDAARLAHEQYGLNAIVLPTIPLGAQNPGQRDLKFCIHYRYDTQRAVLTDTVASLAHQGMHRLLIVNGHGGNSFKPMIRDLAVDYPDMLIATAEWYRLRDARDYFDAPGDHADELETSVMMHYYPHLIDLSKAGEGHSTTFRSEILASGRAWVPRNWLRVSTDTGIGDPRQATAEKGARFAADVTATLARLIADLTATSLY